MLAGYSGSSQSAALQSTLQITFLWCSLLYCVDKPQNHCYLGFPKIFWCTLGHKQLESTESHQAGRDLQLCGPVEKLLGSTAQLLPPKRGNHQFPSLPQSCSSPEQQMGKTEQAVQMAFCEAGEFLKVPRKGSLKEFEYIQKFWMLTHILISPTLTFKD